jgi:hypothetical protein
MQRRTGKHENEGRSNSYSLARRGPLERERRSARADCRFSSAEGVRYGFIAGCFRFFTLIG